MNEILLTAPRQKTALIYGRVFTIALSFMPAAAVFVPRLLGFAPPILGMVAWLIYRPVFGRWPEIPVALLAWLCAIILFAASSALWAIDAGYVLDHVGKIACIFLGGFLLVSTALCVETQFLEFFKKIFPACLIITGALCAVELYSDGAIYKIMHVPLSKDYNLSVFNRSIIVFSLSCFPAIILAYGARRQYVSAKFSAIVLALLLLAVLFKTDSQAAQLGVLVGVAAFFLFPYRFRAVWVLLYGAVAMVILAFPWMATWLFHHVALFIAGYEWAHQSYAAYRLEIWDFVSRRALESPLYGHGIEAARFIKDFDTRRLYHPTSQILHPHSFIAQVWIEFGALGALLAAAFLCGVIKRIKDQGAAARLLLPPFLATVCIASITYGLWQAWWLGSFFMIAAFCIVTARLAMKIKAS